LEVVRFSSSRSSSSEIFKTDWYSVLLHESYYWLAVQLQDSLYSQLFCLDVSLCVSVRLCLSYLTWWGMAQAIAMKFGKV